MKSHDKFHEKQLKSSMEKGLQKKADMLYCLLCGYSPYSEVGNSDRLLICGVYLQAYGKDLPEHLYYYFKEEIKDDFKRKESSDHERVCKKRR